MDKSFWGKKKKRDQMMHRNQEPRVVGGNRNSMQRETSQQRLRSKGLKSALAIRLYVFEIRWQS